MKKKISKKSKPAAKPKARRPKAAKPKSEKPKGGAVSVFDHNGRSVETLEMDPIFQGQANAGVIYQAVLKYQAGEREGTASTKDRGHVRGGGKKPWRQKGSGQARHGSRRSPLWRGGGTTFGPMPRDYSYSLPHEIRRQAVVETVKDKLANSRLFVMNHLDIKEPKSRHVVGILNALKLAKPLVLVDKKIETLLLASRNIPGVTIKTSDEVNALDVASHRECVMTKAAYSGLVKRLKS